jgi:hypothetical protein
LRSAGRLQNHRKPSAIWRTMASSDRSSTSVAKLPLIIDMVAAADRKLKASRPNGTATAALKSRPPSGGPMSSLVRISVDANRDPARSRSASPTVAGTRAMLELSTTASAEASNAATT